MKFAMSAEQTGDSSQAETPKQRGGPLRWIANLLVLVVLVVFLIVGVTAGSFLRFSNDVVSLTPPEEVTEADGIVVLTGGGQRIDQALRLLDEGVAKRLLISGVNPATTGEQIQKLTSTEPALFKCCVDIGHDAIDTRGNANEAADWIDEKGYRTIVVVTSNYHMPRSLLELAKVNSETRFIPYPVVSRDFSQPDWLREPAVLRMLASEYGKYIVARLRHQIGAAGPDGLRSSLAATEPVAAKKAGLSGSN